jgi:L-ascorbate metabolism protein UlaG (beta-lactamase superfamily)
MLEIAGKKLIIDPFLKANPRFKEALWQQAQNPSHVLITHGHNDHLGDAIELAKTNDATIIANFEICNWLTSKGINNCFDMNMGGEVFIGDLLKIVMLPAMHSSSIEMEDGNNIYAGLACGYLIHYNNYSIYHAGDTSIFKDMQLINDLYRPNIGLLPIGGRFTMNIDNAIYICKNIFSFDTIIPMHYDTFPPISVDVNVLKKSLANTDVRILGIGEHTIF